MCGLVGLYGDILHKEKKVFTDLLFLDQLRGRHSTGVTVAQHDGTVRTHKCVGDYFEWKKTFAPQRNKASVFDATRVRMLMGHNRAATLGEVNHANAHPFVHRSFVGAHNGTLTFGDVSRFTVKENWRQEKRSDSRMMFHTLEHEGLDVPKVMSKVSGAYACTVYKKDDGTLHLFRNTQRPLYYRYTKDRRTLIWASEDDMILFAARRHKLELEQNAGFSVDPLFHYTFDIGTKDSKVSLTSKTGYEEPKRQTHHHYTRGTGGWTYTGPKKRDVTVMTPPKTRAKKKKEDKGPWYVY